MIKKSELNSMMLLKKPLTSAIGKLKSIKLLQYDLATFDTRELYEYLGSDSYQDLPQLITYPSDLQAKLLFYLSDIIEDIAKVEGASKFTDLTKFMKAEVIQFLG